MDGLVRETLLLLVRAFGDRTLGLLPLTRLALRFVAALLLLPPAFDDGAMSAPEGEHGHLIGLNRDSGRGGRTELSSPVATPGGMSIWSIGRAKIALHSLSRRMIPSIAVAATLV